MVSIILFTVRPHDGCLNHKIVTSTNMTSMNMTSINMTSMNMTSINMTSTNTTSQSNSTCIDFSKSEWHSFVVDGNRAEIAQSKRCRRDSGCGGSIVGSQLPSELGQTKNVTLVFHHRGCYRIRTNILVKNCASYLIYRFNDEFARNCDRGLCLTSP